jgi:hypothetical protein
LHLVLLGFRFTTAVALESEDQFTLVKFPLPTEQTSPLKN